MATDAPTQHTPGPWTVARESNGLRIWGPTSPGFQAGVADVCIRRSIDCLGPSDEEKANAHMIAAAPNLRAVLECLSKIWDGPSITPKEWFRICATHMPTVRAALAKATPANGDPK